MKAPFWGLHSPLEADTDIHPLCGFPKCDCSAKGCWKLFRSSCPTPTPLMDPRLFLGVEWPLPRSAWHCQHLQFLLQQLAFAYMLRLIFSKNIKPQRGCGAQRLMFITLCTRHPFAKKRRHLFMKTVASRHSWWWFIFTLGSQAANFNRADSKPFSWQSSPKFSPTQFRNVLFFSSLVVIST